MLAEKRAGGRAAAAAATRRRWRSSAPTPRTAQPVRVLAGRYGPYIKHGAINANVPRGADPAALTLDEAVELLAEREAKGPSTGKRGRPAPKKAAAAGKAKKPAAKKPAAKKKPAKAKTAT